jgi:sensor histidine kinase YesM
MVKHNLLIDIENSFNGVINTENNKIITTKKDGQPHGIGLKNVNTIVNNYDGNINIIYLDNKFRVSIMICID